MNVNPGDHYKWHVQDPAAWEYLDMIILGDEAYICFGGGSKPDVYDDEYWDGWFFASGWVKV